MQFDRELACDLAVVSHSPARKGKYAECLIRFARLNLAQDSTAWGIDFSASAEHLTVRVHSILAGSKKAPGWLLCLRTASGLALFALFAGIAPSLAVLLSYAHRPVSQLTSAIHSSAGGMETKARATRKIRSFSWPAPRTADAPVASLRRTEGAQLAMDMSADRKAQNPSSAQASQGPQLLHRSSASGNSSSDNNGAKSNTVALIDPDSSGLASKRGDDAKQALQQSATAAAGIYKRLSGLDRR
jgi:hypothetical protein